MLLLIQNLVISLLVLVLLSVWFKWYFAVPQRPDRHNSISIAPSEETSLGAVILPLAASHPGHSGLTLLLDGRNAFAARVQLADAAEASIDVRYYIWHHDTTGILLLDAMVRAADRGVRVRLLLDDNGTANLDPLLAELETHENIEIRIFNPFVLRSMRVVSFALDFLRLNRRMHNKSFTVDGVATIVGGRNVGDDYFSNSDEVNFFDLDVLALGQAAADVAQDFDLYWASKPAVEAQLILRKADPDKDLMTKAVDGVRGTPLGQEFAASLQQASVSQKVLEGAFDFEWAKMQLVSDNPAKGLGPLPDADLMMFRLEKILTPPKESVDIVSAYFVPGDKLTEMLSRWAEQGIQVGVLTNSQEATDVLAVQSGYIKYRSKLLDAGVSLFEFKADQPKGLLHQFALAGTSKGSLHAKTFLIDHAELFVGSFNFDPRSARLNSEMGFLIQSPAIADAAYPEYSQQIQARSYRVERMPDGSTEWIEDNADGTEWRYHTEPGTNWFSRGLVRVISWLPVIWLL